MPKKKHGKASKTQKHSNKVEVEEEIEIQEDNIQSPEQNQEVVQEQSATVVEDDQEKQSQPEEHRLPVKAVQKLIGSKMKIMLPDGRKLVGLFDCLDNSCNIILANCHETIYPDTPGSLLIFFFLQVLINSIKIPFFIILLFFNND